DDVGDLSTADNADLTVNDEGGAVLGDGATSYDLDDDSYSKYFNDDGTPTDVINESSDYTLNVGTLNNKDIQITYGSNIHIIGKEGAGFINNGTIIIGNGLGEASAIEISGLTFTNTNKDGIYVNENSTMITIQNNKFDLTYDSDYYNSPMAIAAFGQVYGISILDNNIKMVSEAGYNYGIDISNYLPAPTWDHGAGNAELIDVRNNVINITSTVNSGMVEAMYIDSVVNSEFVNNTIYTYSGEGVANYGMALVDSWGYTVMANLFEDDYTGGYSPYNVLIDDNKVNIESGDMAYGITAISWYNTDEWNDDIIKNIVISNNDLIINSEKGAIGIGAQSSDVKITDNKVTINAHADAQVTANPDPVFGDDSNAITILNLNDVLGYYYNTTVTDNIITTNVPAIFIDKTKGNGYYSPEPIDIEDNTVTYTGAVEYTIDDDHYFLFFNDDGTPTDLLNPEGNYALNLGNLTNKDIKILTGSNINVTGVEGNSLTNSTIIIGDGAGSASAVIVKDLVIVNINKNGIVVNDESKDITLNNNTLDLTYDSAFSGSAMAIVIYGHSEDISVINNNINIESAVKYTYGIDASLYVSSGYGSDNSKNFFIINNNINIHSASATGSVNAIYLDTLTNSMVGLNKIYVKTENDLANYGIALADSSNSAGSAIAAPHNVTITGNEVYLDSNDMANGISVISRKAFDGSKDFYIVNNDVTVNSAKGAHGIAVYTPDVEISGNTVTVFADPDAVNNAYISRYLGSHSAGILINNVDPNSNNTVKNNEIYTTVDKINYTNVEDEQLKPIIEDNIEKSSYIINDDTYSTYFDDNGIIKDDAPIAAGDTLLLGDLTNKKLVIDTQLTIKGSPNTKLVNSTINVMMGADNTVIDGLTMEFTGDETTGSVGIIYISDVNNVTISNNKITVPNFVSNPASEWGTYVMPIEIENAMLGCNDIYIHNNDIHVEGTCTGLYGIDVFSWGVVKTKNLYIFENNFFLNGGSSMAEAIYVSAYNLGADGVIIDGNTIHVISDGAAYGIGTDYLTNSMITSNDITLEAGNMAYGITATTSGSDNTIRGNNINAKGTGAVGIGVNYQNGITIEDNTVAIDGGDYTTITSSDSLGTANAGILVGDGNTGVEISGNDVSEKTPLRSDTAIEANNITVTAASSGNGSYEITLRTAGGMALANQVVKVVFNNQMYELTTDANGVAVLPFALNKGGVYNVEVFYLGDEDYRGSDASATITINKIATKTTAAAKTYLATAKTKSFSTTLKDAKGNVLANKKVTFTVNGKTYTATTNAKGVATVKLALTAAKKYTVTIKFAGDGVYAASTVSAKVTLNKEKTKITAPKKTFKRTAKTKKVVITLKNSKGKAIAKKKVTLTVNKKKYTAKTNKKGKATFKVKLTKKGTKKYTVKFAGDSQYKAVKKTGKIVIK
ncbi:MAG: Ig-like domain repeat protein, partial [Acholeplasmatales bacterium]|nr:Ig-like domain repeat protein [Acholeplasmatales bacterium]